jgi:hypothetical protein
MMTAHNCRRLIAILAMMLGVTLTSHPQEAPCCTSYSQSP